MNFSERIHSTAGLPAIKKIRIVFDARICKRVETEKSFSFFPFFFKTILPVSAHVSVTAVPTSPREFSAFFWVLRKRNSWPVPSTN